MKNKHFQEKECVCGNTVTKNIQLKTLWWNTLREYTLIRTKVRFNGLS